VRASASALSMSLRLLDTMRAGSPRSFAQPHILRRAYYPRNSFSLRSELPRKGIFTLDELRKSVRRASAGCFPRTSTTRRWSAGSTRHVPQRPKIDGRSRTGQDPLRAQAIRRAPAAAVGGASRSTPRLSPTMRQTLLSRCLLTTSAPHCR
jgi:hypothetical protein